MVTATSRGLAAAVVAALSACAYSAQRPALLNLDDAAGAEATSPFLKAHMRSGNLYLLARWSVRDSARVLEGDGVRYDGSRAPRDSGHFRLGVDSIALVETNVRENHYPAGLAALGAMTVLLGGATVGCVADPKSCFGSCPTFYVDGGSSDRPVAEGFSASAARVLEATDVDALGPVHSSKTRFALVMRNEALETHVVRTVRLQAVRHPPGEYAFATPAGGYLTARRVAAPLSCTAPEGNCLAAVLALDTLERQSRTDSSDLAARESIVLEFPVGAGRQGIVLSARHTFVSTYVFYQMLAYMGRAAGDWFAQLERLGPGAATQALGLTRALGGIEIAVWEPEGLWRTIGTYDEAGPIASDIQILPLPSGVQGAHLRVRLRMARGSWRLGYVALAGETATGESVALSPVAVEHRGHADPEALRVLRDTLRTLVTVPGDAYRIVFDLPERPQTYSLFLESRGYYYEWIRDDWLREENPGLMALALADPPAALRRMAPAFKQIESGMEASFWRSRFGRERR